MDVPPHVPPALEMRGVDIASLRDQSVTIVEDVNWRAERGDFWVVAGLQGAGKTDFLMTTASLMPPKGGEYRMQGERMPIFEEARLDARLRLGLVFENGQLFNHLTIKENVALPLRYHLNLSKASAEARAMPWLMALELEPWADSTPGAVGRNWARRAGLARALALGPEILLADNPLGGLDLRDTRWWLRSLGELSKGHPLLQERPMTIVVTAADLRPWKNIARQFAIVRDRRFTVLGAWAQVEAADAGLARELLMLEGKTE